MMGRIVIVDDSRLARTFTASCLKRLPHTVDVVDPTSIFDVVKVLKETPPDLLIMDFLMPNCPGTSLARVIQEDTQLWNMKTLVLTAHHDDDVTSRLKEMGVAEVMFKPFSPGDLVAMVISLMP